jgi:hypothetical protein
MKWSLKVPIYFLAKFLQWSSGGTHLYVIFDTNPSNSVVDSMANFMRAEHWLSRVGALVLVLSKEHSKD